MEIKYKCRYCGEVFEKDEDVKVTSHECEDGRVGIAEREISETAD